MAEVSVALAGFTGVVAAFGQRRGQWSAADTLRFRVMLGTSLSALGVSILPFAVHHMGAGPANTWCISSAIVAAFIMTMMLVNTYWVHQLGAWTDPSFGRWVPFVSYSVSTAAVVGLVLNAVGVGFDRSFGPYFLALCVVLLNCALMFIRLLSFVGQQFAEE
jgi:heme/copper-type cytochrome/quinol oxidase subunit 4